MHAANDESCEKLPNSESVGDQDDIDMAAFGKRPQLKASCR